MGRMVALLALAGMLAMSTARAGGEDLAVWPNRASRANSDEWLVKNHDSIRQMRPRVLVLNFVNGLSSEEARKRVDALIAALRESSRYHGYKDRQAAPFLEYQVEKLVDLTDAAPPADRMDGNSTRYPRVPNWKDGQINFQYSQLFGPKFAEYYGYADPKQPGRFLTLKELVDAGTVHEVWFLAQQRQLGAPYESVEVKQAYDERFRKIPGVSKQAGNGGDPGQPFIGRSLRILFINAERGPGCAMESLGHSMEGMAHSNVIPYFRRYFYEYAGFDLDRRFGVPFKSLYEAPKPLDYPNPTTLRYRDKSGKDVEVSPFYIIGGNVHFTPNGRKDYDLDNPQPVMSTIEDYRIGSRPGGKDLAKEWGVETYRRYRGLAHDCMGPWLVYWRQNMPGYRSPARDADGKPMKNWGVFLFY